MIKPFKLESDKFWVNGKPYQVTGNEITALAGKTHQEDVELLKEYLGKKILQIDSVV